MVIILKIIAYISEKHMEGSKTIATEKLLMQQLHSLNWEDVWISLMGRSVYILKNRFRVNWSKDKIHAFSRQIICEVIEKIFVTQERKWNVDRYPEFIEFIEGAIDSHISNTLIKESKNLNKNKEIDDTKVGDNQPSPDEKVSSEELRNQIYTELQKAGATDEELLIFECLADGIEKPKELRKELGITEKEFHNLWRKFNRKRELIRKKYIEYGN